MQNRTDLALELKEEADEQSSLKGVSMKTRIDASNDIKEKNYD